MEPKSYIEPNTPVAADKTAVTGGDFKCRKCWKLKKKKKAILLELFLVPGFIVYLVF